MEGPQTSVVLTNKHSKESSTDTLADYKREADWQRITDRFRDSILNNNKEKKSMKNTLKNSCVSGASKNVKDLTVFGDGDTFKLLCKAHSIDEGWVKSTKAMEIEGVGCVVQVTTQQWDDVAEALTFVPGVKIEGNATEGRKLIAL